MLEDLGHTVITPATGSEAIETLDCVARIDLLVADQAMPNMTRLQLADTVHERPDVPVIIATGYTARITAQLIDATTGNHVWANRFDEEGDNIIALQDAVAARVFNALAGFKGELRKSEEQTAWGKDGIALGEYDYYLHGHQIFFRYTEKDMAEARRVWREGLGAFPNSALLRIKIAMTHFQDAAWGWSDDPDRDLDAGWKLLEEAAAIPNRPRLVEWYLHYLHAVFAMAQP